MTTKKKTGRGAGKNLKVKKETLRDLDANKAKDIKGGTIKVGGTTNACRGKYCSGFQTQ